MGRWWWPLWNAGVRWLTSARILRCQYCSNGEARDHCSCGACGVIYPGSHGYDWCDNYLGHCRYCLRRWFE